MTSTVQQAWQDAQVVEKDLRVKLDEREPAFKDIQLLMTRYRTACEDVLFRDFKFATDNEVDGRLWDAHGKVNTLFRKELGQFQKEANDRRVVQKRRLAKYYLEFIKSSQRFYRAYVQRLASSSTGLPELEQVARQFKLQHDPARDQGPGDGHLRRRVLLSCYQTLIRLGDLSRYRETELAGDARNWGPAVGYYDLASAVLPASGVAHNQLAAIALVDGSHLRATYHLYRALAAEEPHQSAKRNLEVEFKKIVHAWRKGDLIVKGSRREVSSTQALSAWFVLLHARSYRGEDVSNHDELEGEVLGRLTVSLKQQLPEHTLSRLILINIAAEHVAGIRVREEHECQQSFQAYFFSLRLNLKTFIGLLELLHQELELDGTGRDRASSESTKESIRRHLTPTVHRILPGLRNYSSWLSSDFTFLVAGVGDADLRSLVKRFWKIYARSLTCMAAVFPAADLPTVDYLLQEDEDTLGFKPFDSEHARGRYYVKGARSKPKWYELGVKKLDMDDEMLARVRDFLADALVLVVEESIPIALRDGGVFVYTDPDQPVEGVLNVPGNEATGHHMEGRKAEADGKNTDTQQVIVDPVSTIASDDLPNGPAVETHGEMNGLDDRVETSTETQEPTAQAMTAAMNHIVDSLVGPASPVKQNHTDGGDKLPSPGTAEHTTGETTYGEPSSMTAAQLVQIVETYSQRTRHVSSTGSSSRRSSRPQSSSVLLPSIWNTPFAPQPTDMALSASSTSSPRAGSTSAAAVMTRPTSFARSSTGGVGGGGAGGNSTLGSFHSSSIVSEGSWYTGSGGAMASSTTSAAVWPGVTNTSTPSAFYGNQQQQQQQQGSTGTHRGGAASPIGSTYVNDSTYEALVAAEHIWNGWNQITRGVINGGGSTGGGGHSSHMGGGGGSREMVGMMEATPPNGQGSAG